MQGQVRLGVLGVNSEDILDPAQPRVPGAGQPFLPAVLILDKTLPFSPRVMAGEGPPPTTCARHGTDPGGASPLRAARPEPLAKGNCVTARWGGEEAGGKPRS